MDIKRQNAASKVEKSSKLGTKHVNEGVVEKALECFKDAYTGSQVLKDASIIRSCAFNLGAAHVASGNIEQGIQYLKKALPPEDTTDGCSHGDLYYNLALANEQKGDNEQTRKYLEKAYDAYKCEKNFEMVEDVLQRLVQLSRKETQLKVRWLEKLAPIYEIMEKHEKCASTYLKCLGHYNEGSIAKEFPDIDTKCRIAIEKVNSSTLLVKMYNSLGLFYVSQEKYQEALDCFHKAIDAIDAMRPETSIYFEAVTEQNIGGLYIMRHEYRKSIKYGAMAAEKFGRLNERKSQGQCFLNQACASSQLLNIEDAKELFAHALLAARNCDDKTTQWQALEGLGAVATNKKQLLKAEEYYREARDIMVLANTTKDAQDRIYKKFVRVVKKLPLVKMTRTKDRNGMSVAPTNQVQVNDKTEIEENRKREDTDTESDIESYIESDTESDTECEDKGCDNHDDRREDTDTESDIESDIESDTESDTECEDKGCDNHDDRRGNPLPPHTRRLDPVTVAPEASTQPTDLDPALIGRWPRPKGLNQRPFITKRVSTIPREDPEGNRLQTNRPVQMLLATYEENPQVTEYEKILTDQEANKEENTIIPPTVATPENLQKSKSEVMAQVHREPSEDESTKDEENSEDKKTPVSRSKPSVPPDSPEITPVNTYEIPASSEHSDPSAHSHLEDNTIYETIAHHSSDYASLKFDPSPKVQEMITLVRQLSKGPNFLNTSNSSMSGSESQQCVSDETKTQNDGDPGTSGKDTVSESVDTVNDNKTEQYANNEDDKDSSVDVKPSDDADGVTEQAQSEQRMQKYHDERLQPTVQEENVNQSQICKII